MSEMTKAALSVILVLGLLAYSTVLVVGTAYIVFVLGYSGWWWALTVCLMGWGASVKATVK